MANLEVILKTQLAQLEDANERRRLSGDPSDYDEVLSILTTMTEELTRVALRYLGDPGRADSSINEEIRSLSAAIELKPDQFVKGAPTAFLAELVGRQEQNLRDIAYLREGYGLAGGRPRPTDMKWDHPGSVASDVVSTFSRLFGSLRSDGAEVHRLVPEISFDPASMQRGVIQLLEQDMAPHQFMGAAIDLAERETEAAGWDAYRELAYEQELTKRQAFFLEVVEREPPRKPLTGFGIEIANPSRDGETTADLWLMGGSDYRPDDETWLEVQEYAPRAHSAHSEVLGNIYRLAYAPGGLGNAADFTLCLAWGTYFARACAYRYLEETGLERIGLSVGFGGGDWIDLGWLEADH